jgi:acyl carrier protein
MEWFATTTERLDSRPFWNEKTGWNSNWIRDSINTVPPRSALLKNPMIQTQVIARLQPIFDDLFMQPVVLRPDLTADEVEEWDSLLQISLLLTVERHFGIRFRVGEVESTKNVGELADLIARRMANG